MSEDKDNHTLICGHQRESETGPHGHECWGHDPTQKDSDKSVRLAQQARKTLGTLFETVYRVACGEKHIQAYCDKFERIHIGNHVDTRVSREKGGKLEQDCSVRRPLVDHVHDSRNPASQNFSRDRQCPMRKQEAQKAAGLCLHKGSCGTDA